jgi:hypothetical protein
MESPEHKKTSTVVGSGVVLTTGLEEVIYQFLRLLMVISPDDF